MFCTSVLWQRTLIIIIIVSEHTAIAYIIMFWYLLRGYIEKLTTRNCVYVVVGTSELSVQMVWVTAQNDKMRSYNILMCGANAIYVLFIYDIFILYVIIRHRCDIYKNLCSENKIYITKVLFKDVLNEYFRITKHRSVSRWVHSHATINVVVLLCSAPLTIARNEVSRGCTTFSCLGCWAHA